MALITSDCDAIRFRASDGPNHPGFVVQSGYPVAIWTDMAHRLTRLLLYKWLAVRLRCSQPKRCHAGRLDKIDRLFSVAPLPDAAGKGTAFRLRFHCLSSLRHIIAYHCISLRLLQVSRLSEQAQARAYSP